MKKIYNDVVGQRELKGGGWGSKSSEMDLLFRLEPIYFVFLMK